MHTSDTRTDRRRAHPITELLLGSLITIAAVFLTLTAFDLFFSNLTKDALTGNLVFSAIMGISHAIGTPLASRFPRFHSAILFTTIATGVIIGSCITR